ncbi:MAG: glycosyltransferase, partial [Thermoplasmata archaeon]|nr:glycosyltransferase [Thermoplasmata archaeon]
PTEVATHGSPQAIASSRVNGIPCVATSVGGIPEVLTDKVNGYIVKPGDKEGLNRAILQVLKNKEGVGKLSENARRTIEERFSSSRMVEGYLGLYESLIKT